MTTHRPTTLQLLIRHCPAALDHYEAGHPQDRRVFHAGTAAHEFLHALGEGRDLQDLAVRLMSQGRTGVDPEPPMPPDAVIEGRDLALAYVERHPLPAGAYYEQRFAFDALWQPVEVDPYIATRVDRVAVEVDEDEDGFASTTVVVTDYKSAWPAVETELDTLQRRIQGVCAWLAYPEATHLRLEVANLRRREVYARTITLDDDGIALLERWRDDITALCQAADVRPRVATPSPGCATCPWVGRCSAAAAAGWQRPGDASLEAAAAALGAAKGLAKAAEDTLRELTHDAPLTVGGWEIGAKAGKGREVRPTALVAAVSAWLDRSHVPLTPEQRAALEALCGSLEVPVKLGEALAKALHPRKPEREAWLQEHLVEVVRPTWGVRLASPAPVSPDEVF
jgi:hypothetical protein